MVHVGQRSTWRSALSLIAAVAGSVIWTHPVNSATDWGLAFTQSTMARNPDASSLTWRYQYALYLYGQYQVYLRTQDAKLLQYIKDWGDKLVDAEGNPYFDAAHQQPVDTSRLLDHLLAGRLMVILHRETGLAKYQLAADKLNARFAAWPRTSDGGFWHAVIRPWQLWLDGAYVALPFMMEYARAFGDVATAGDEAAKQLRLHIEHLQDPTTGLLYHAYDELAQQPWANPTTRRSPEFWCRGIGWHLMAIVETLERLPLTQAERPTLLAALARLAAGLERYQDTKTRRWFQVVDKGSLSTNWVETSCSSMVSYGLARAVEDGYLPLSFHEAASRGYQGTHGAASIGSDGRANLAETVVGVAPGNLTYYLSRPRAVNEFHGLGAFLIMHEQFNKRPAGSVFKWIEAESGTFTSPLRRISDTRASGGAALGALAGTNSTSVVPSSGRVRLSFTLTAGGSYRIWGRTLAPTTTSDTFWARIDNGSWQVWGGLAVGSSWLWEDLNRPTAVKEPLTASLAAGTHTVDVAYREGGARLDRVLITNVPTYVPGGKG